MVLTGFFCAFACLLSPGQVSITADRVSANGAVIGTYVDNEVPDRAARVERARGLRLAGVAPYELLPRLSGAVRLREFYPVWKGSDWRLAAGDGFILQGSFRWPGERAPTYRDRRRMWCMAKARHPLIVLWYAYSAPVAQQVARIERSRCGQKGRD